MKFFHKKRAAGLSFVLIALAICGVLVLFATYFLHVNRPDVVLESFSTVRLGSSSISFVIPNTWSVHPESPNAAYIERIVIIRPGDHVASVSVLSESDTSVVTSMYGYKTTDVPMDVRGMRLFPRSAESPASDPDIYLFNSNGYTYVFAGDQNVLNRIWSTWGIALE